MIRSEYPWEEPAYRDAMAIRAALCRDERAVVRMELFAEWEVEPIRAFLTPQERYGVYFTWLFGNEPGLAAVGVSTLIDKDGKRRKAA